MRRRTLLSLTAATALGGALTACGSAVTGEDPADGSGGADGTVRVGHLPSALFAPLYVADAKGYFEAEGITLELTPLKSGQDGVPMLANDQLEDGTVSSVADLEGRTIGVAGGPGATGGYLLAAMLEEGGLTLNDVEISNLATPDQEPALTNGSVDAATPSAPFSSSIEEAG